MHKGGGTCDYDCFQIYLWVEKEETTRGREGPQEDLLSDNTYSYNKWKISDQWIV